MTTSPGVRPVDALALARSAARMARAAEPPWLHGEVARRMAERLPLVKLRPQRVIDWWSHAGAGRAVLRATYPEAEIVAVERAPRQDARWWLPRRFRHAAVAEDVPAAGSAQLVWANMMLHLVADPPALIARWHALLAVDGFLMLSTLGPDTLATLREIYHDAGWGPPQAAFVDMHDLGDMLVAAGFAAPVMDQERVTLTWPSAAAALAELRGLGGNADASRHAGARTPRWRARLEAALTERAGADGRIALPFEIVYGHAFKPEARARGSGETRIALEALRESARRAGGPGKRG